MHNPASILGNDTLKLLWDFEIRNLLWDFDIHNLGQKTTPYNNKKKEENLQNCGLCYPGPPQNKIERK